MVTVGIVEAVGTGLIIVSVLVSSASLSDLAAFHALVLVECWPRLFVLLVPFSHQRKFHVLRLLSKTTLPVLNRAALVISSSFPQGTRMALRMLARQIP